MGSPSKPRPGAGTLRRLTGSLVGVGSTIPSLPQTAKHEQTLPLSARARAVSRMFAEAVVRVPAVGDKAKAVLERRRNEVLEVFLVQGREGQ